jgi:hypothetical protein
MSEISPILKIFSLRTNVPVGRAYSRGKFPRRKLTPWEILPDNSMPAKIFPWTFFPQFLHK